MTLKSVTILGLPPIFVQASDLEQVYDDSISLESKGKVHNIEVTLDLYNNLPHVFQAFKIPQAQVVFFVFNQQITFFRHSRNLVIGWENNINDIIPHLRLPRKLVLQMSVKIVFSPDFWISCCKLSVL